MADRLLGFLRRMFQGFFNSLDFDGMDLSEIIEDIERRWSIKTDDFQIGPEATVDDLAQCIAMKANVKVKEVVAPLIAIIADRMSRDPATIHASSRLIRDLGMG